MGLFNHLTNNSQNPTPQQNSHNEKNGDDQAATAKKNLLTPVHLFSHGSTMMLGEESASASYWAKCGREALANGVEHVVMMGAHWATSLPNTVLISANPTPSKSPVAFVAPHKYKSYALNPDMAFIPAIQSHLSRAGIASKLDHHFDWIHDTYLVLIRMFPSGCPPTTIISANYAYDPHFHVSVGAALRPLRSDKTLFIGSGGSVHNLYRNVWGPMLQHRDNFAQPTPPEPWALDFRQEVIDTFCAGYEQESSPLPKSIPYGREIRSSSRAAPGGGVGGPLLRRKATSLMKHPKYRDAHATDDHFMATMFVAGLCGSVEDVGVEGVLGAEDWELTNMCNSQFTLGGWD
ncbi:Extradiol ring-cleavage dioxygenase, class III enzyme, subunit B [Rhypophila decipiens]|uniref:Extradiol ring-cleavage dioxygenase, class III enzyme, subunit B n=1 Tax=Rhypophila decipiens TaxID=261697 RepID=A0AAN6YJ14_9PEZI|nr:Extradiol ring-cleavage dioxygenase, class III enzyme, subunit B [Rhypophila decipiens]